MVVGFTGTQRGMTDAQRRVVSDLLLELKPDSVVHGDCLGADEDFHRLALNRKNQGKLRIVIRPGHNTRGENPTRAYCKGADYIYPSRPYLVRDEDIVKDSDVIIACPSGMNEVMRSGTWATVRKARKHHVPQYIVGPNGALL